MLKKILRGSMNFYFYVDNIAKMLADRPVNGA